MTQQEFNRWVVERLQQLIPEKSKQDRDDNALMFRIEIENMLQSQLTIIEGE